MAVYAFSDLHGCYGLWEQVKNYCKEDDTIYFLGDAADRGFDGVKIIKELLEDKRIIYIKGNHEQFIDCLKEDKHIDGYDSILWENNGGKKTKEDILKMNNDEYLSFKKRMNNILLFDWYTNSNNKKIFLSHAGCLSFAIQENIENKSFGLLWNRTHLSCPWFGEEQEELGGNNLYIVHGHTPTPYFSYFANSMEIPNYFPGDVVFYADNHKIDIDGGCFFTGRLPLINLDTFEVTYFYSEEYDERSDKYFKGRRN